MRWRPGAFAVTDLTKVPDFGHKGIGYIRCWRLLFLTTQCGVVRTYEYKKQDLTSIRTAPHWAVRKHTPNLGGISQRRQSVYVKHQGIRHICGEVWTRSSWLRVLSVLSVAGENQFRNSSEGVCFALSYCCHPCVYIYGYDPGS